MPCRRSRALGGSHHALAMQKATPRRPCSAILRRSARSLRRRHHVSGVRATSSWCAPRPRRRAHDYEIAYTFGVYPLQQYLIALPGGRFRRSASPGTAGRRSRAASAGSTSIQIRSFRPAIGCIGQDATRPGTTMCADCHSTDLSKNYDLATNTYATTWTDVNVSCEACHGPGSRHVAWAQAARRGTGPTRRDHDGTWTHGSRPADEGRLGHEPSDRHRQAHGTLGSARTRCLRARAIRGAGSSRRLPVPGAPLLDSYLPALLEPGLYHADGQIDGEVYEYGSFCKAGCTMPASPARIAMNRIASRCAPRAMRFARQCHLPAKFDVAAHHHHDPGSAGAQCVDCHMPAKTYMVVDAGAITAFVCRARICRRRSARRTPAPHAMPTRARNGRRARSPNGFRPAGKPWRTTASRLTRGGPARRRRKPSRPS